MEDVDNSNGKDPAPRGLSDAMTLAGLTALGYACAYAREVGFCAMFHVPAEFISLTPVTVFLATASLAGFLALVLLPTSLPLTLGRLGATVMLPASVMLVGLATYLYFGSFNPWNALAVPIFFALGRWLDTRHLKPMKALKARIEAEKPMMAEFLERVAAAEGTESERQAVDALRTELAQRLEETDRQVGEMDRRLGRLTPLGSLIRKERHKAMAIGTLVGSVVACVFSFGLGSDEAHRKIDFLVPSVKLEVVVLRIYGDRLICARLDRARKQVEQSFYVLQTTGAPDRQLRLEAIGPLTSVASLAPPPTPAPGAGGKPGVGRVPRLGGAPPTAGAQPNGSPAPRRP